MSEKIRKDEGKKVIDLNKTEDLLNKIEISREIEKGQNFFSEPKEEINFDSIDFNINPFKSEDINKKEKNKLDELIVGNQSIEQKRDAPYSQYYDIPIGLKTNNYIENYSKEKKTNENNLHNINFNNKSKNQSNSLINPYNINKNNNYNETTKILSNIFNIREDSNPLIQNSYNNINLNSNPFFQNLYNQINNNNSYKYINSNNFNNQISYDNNQIIDNNQLNFSNNFNTPRLREQYWICSLCNDFNIGGKNLIYFFFIFLIRKFL